MGQGNIIKILRKSKKKFLTANEIADLTKTNKSTVRNTLKKLRKRNEVCFEQRKSSTGQGSGEYIYAYKK